MQRVVHEIDPEFNIRTSYHNDLFLLRTRVLVNGENVTITSKEGSYEDPVMSFCHGGITISIKLWSVENTISPILHKCGIYMFYYEQSPLFHIVFSSESCVRKLLQEIQTVRNAMLVELQSFFFFSFREGQSCPQKGIQLLHCQSPTRTISGFSQSTREKGS